MLRVISIIFAILFPLSAVLAQDLQPTCKNCPGTQIENQELQTYLQRAIANKIVDQQIRGVDIGKANVDIGVVYRGKLAAPAPNSVAEHDQVSEIYYILDGSATLVTGPDLVGEKRRPPNAATRDLNGPGNDAASIQNGMIHELKPGDVMIIPAGTGHWYTKISDHITYLMIRVDPDKVTPHKGEAESKAYLASPVKK